MRNSDDVDGDSVPLFWQRANMVWGAIRDDHRSVSREERQFANEAMRKKERFEKFLASRGKRYQDCRAENYKATCDQQQAAKNELAKYCRDPQSITNGRNIVLYGPSGSGKDHLLVAAARVVHYRLGIVPTWHNGVEMAKRWRDSVRDWESGDSFDDDLRDAEVLYISDPLPPTGVLSEFLQEKWFDLVDYRYRNQLPIWCSLNVADGDEAELRLSVPIVDRLRDGALCVHCNWPSYRGAK